MVEESLLGVFSRDQPDQGSFPALKSRDRLLSLKNVHIMGILNVTPDSFSDGGRWRSVDQAVQQAWNLFRAGATIIDVGGESSRPNAQWVSEEQELERIMPVLTRIVGEIPIWVSVDTRKPGVMKEVLSLGVDLINDVQALRAPGALELVARSGAAVCLVHAGDFLSTGTPAGYPEGVLEAVRVFFEERLVACSAAGIDSDRILLDPGFGFSKTLEENFRILAKLECLAVAGKPLLVGLSRKSMLKRSIQTALKDREVSFQEILSGGLSAAVLSVLKGAKILRVHDVAETAAALRVLQATLEASSCSPHFQLA